MRDFIGAKNRPFVPEYRKKYFLNQFHDLENQLKIVICGNGALALLNLKI